MNEIECLDICPVDTFTEMPFPENRNIVYAVGLLHDSRFWPFYIGQSSRNVGRFGDYVSANFSASTDFKVGQAVEELKKRNYQVLIRYRESRTKDSDERVLIEKARKLVPLLNDISGYNYRTANPDEEKSRIGDYIDALLAKLGSPRSPMQE